MAREHAQQWGKQGEYVHVHVVYAIKVEVHVRYMNGIGGLCACIVSQFNSRQTHKENCPERHDIIIISNILCAIHAHAILVTA